MRAARLQDALRNVNVTKSGKRREMMAQLSFNTACELGFRGSLDELGGMIAQQLALDYPELVQRLILLGTGPRGGEGMTFTELSAEEQADPVAFLLGAFFSPSQSSQAAGREYIKRLESRKEDRDLPVSRNSAAAQLAAIREWERFQRLVVTRH